MEFIHDIVESLKFCANFSLIKLKLLIRGRETEKKRVCGGILSASPENEFEYHNKVLPIMNYALHAEIRIGRNSIQIAP